MRLPRRKHSLTNCGKEGAASAMLEINLRAVGKRKDMESVVCSRNDAVATTLKKNKERRINGEEKKDIERERERMESRCGLRGC